jgi:hypothetical protein
VAAPVVVSVVKVELPEAVNDVRVVAPVTLTVDENVAAPAWAEEPESVVTPVTPSVPPTVVAPVMDALASVEAPAVKVEENVPAPVTANVLPRVVAPVTPRVLDKLVAPVTPSVPAMTVFPDAAATVNLFVLTATSPVTPSVPPTVAAPVIAALASVEAPAVKVEEKVPAPVTANVLPRVVAPVTPKVLDKVVAPVTPSVPAIEVLPDVPVTLNLFVFTAKSPVTAALASVEAPAVKVEENVPAAPLKSPVKLKEVPFATPIFGVTKTGDVANTNTPDPVSSVTAAFKLALVGVAKKLATPVPNPLTPVEIGKPVPLVKVTEVGVPNRGVTKVGLVDKTKLPDPVDVVTPVPPCATSMVVALQVPCVIVPTEVKLDPVTLDFKVVPDKVPASAMIEADPAAVRRPLASTVKVGINVEEPYVPEVTPEFANVAAAVTSPEPLNAGLV